MKLPKNITKPIRVAFAIKPTDVRIVRIKPTGWVGCVGDEIFSFDQNEDLMKYKGFTVWMGLSSQNYENVKKNFLKYESMYEKFKILKITEES